MPKPDAHWFDAHLDLAYLAVGGRDMTAEDPLRAGGPCQPGAVTIPSLLAGGVRCALGTIFTEAGGDGPGGYPAGDAAAAHRKGRAQLEAYLTWQDMGLVAIDLPGALRQDKHVGEIRGGMGVTEIVPHPPIERLDAGTLHLGILMESADPIRTPDELPWWTERGLVMVGMAWWRSSRYAGGNGHPQDGLTDLGRELADAMDATGVVHDLSHLSQKATDELLEHTDALVVASHSNARALIEPADERHLADETIREIARRGGVVGVNLVSDFLRSGLSRESGERATIDDVVKHIEHIAGVAGRRDAVALGSDMDGGLTRENLPEGINGPSDLEKLAEALRAAGWTEAEIDGFRWRNWTRVLTESRAAAKA
jgi:membrane dipeptidase